MSAVMKAIVTAVHDDGAQWGWPGEAVFRYRGEDGSWGWVPQEDPRRHHAVGDIIDADGGWEWLPENEQRVKISTQESRTPQERRVALVRQAEKLDKLELRHDKKTSAQLDRDIAEALGVFRLRKKTS
jgi:hypothetical protein